MKSKMKFLTMESFKRKVKTKWFLAANIILALLIVGVCNIDSLIKIFGGDFNEPSTIYVIDKTDESYDIFESQINIATKNLSINDKKEDKEDKEDKEKDSDFIIKEYKKEVKEAKKLANKDKKNIILIIENDKENTIKATLITKEYLESTAYQTVYNAINGTKSTLALSRSDIDVNELAKISSPAEINREYIDESKSEKGEEGEILMNAVFPVIILPVFMLSLFLVQMIGAEVNDEKTTRGMEIIISSVSPKVHFASKIIASNLFVILQSVLLFIYSGLGLLSRMLLSNNSSSGTEDISDLISEIVKTVTAGDMGEKLIVAIPLTIILILLTFLAYSLLAGVLASMTTNIEDFQQLQTPIVIISLGGYYLALMSNMFAGSLFIKIFSYIPFISSILSPAIFLTGQISIIDMIISIVIMMLTVFVLIKYGMKIYKQGILNYTSKDLWKKIFKALKN